MAGGLNLYGFAGGDPINFSDPFGLCPPEWMCRLIGASAGQSAVEHYARVAIDPSSSGLQRAAATAGGLFASLWTPDTYLETGGTLVAAGATNLVLKREGGRAALALLAQLIVGDPAFEEGKRERERIKREQQQEQRDQQKQSGGCSGEGDPTAGCGEGSGNDGGR